MMHFNDLGYIEKQEKIWEFLKNAAIGKEVAARQNYINADTVFDWEVAVAAVEEAIKQHNYYTERVKALKEELAKQQEAEKTEAAKACQKTDGNCVLTATEAES